MVRLVHKEQLIKRAHAVHLPVAYLSLTIPLIRAKETGNPIFLGAQDNRRDDIPKNLTAIRIRQVFVRGFLTLRNDRIFPNKGA